MIECDRCHRHVRATETTCPFCVGGPRLSVRVMNGLGAALTTWVLAACYGSFDGSKDFTFTGVTGDTGTTTTDTDLVPTTGDTGTTPGTTGGTGATGGTTGGTGLTGGSGPTEGPVTLGGSGSTSSGSGSTR